MGIQDKKSRIFLLSIHHIINVLLTSIFMRSKILFVITPILTNFGTTKIIGYGFVRKTL
jgi:hypothetical protein